MFELTMALRYLRSRRKEGFASLITILSFLGIFLGVMVLIIVTSIFSGFRQELINSFIGIDGHVSISGSEGSIAEYPSYIEQIKQIDGVTGARAIIQDFVLISAENRSVPASIRGYRSDDLMSIEEFTSPLSPTQLQALTSNEENEDLPRIILGSGLAYQLGIWEEGHRVTLMSSKLVETPFGPTYSTTDFWVSGLFTTGNMRYDDYFALMDFDKAAWFLNLDGNASKIDVFIEDPSTTQEISKGIYGLNRYDIYVQTWQNQYGDIVAAIEVEGNIAFLIVGLVILVSAFTIISSLVMLVHAKTKDIGILRTIGATQGQIRRIFLLSGLIIGVFGTSFGAIFGVVIAHNVDAIRLFLNETFGLNLFPVSVFNMPALPSDVDYSLVVILCIATVLLTLLASIYPAIRAAKIDPAEALKHD